MNGFIGAIGALFFKQSSKRLPDEPVEVSIPARTETAARCTVLAIDDDQTFLDALRSGLRMEGFNVMTAISGAKGLDMMRFAKNDIRVVLLDFQMPRLTGLETLHHVRKLLPKAKILGLTGLAKADLPEEFLTQVDLLMNKPYRTPELVQCLNFLAEVETPAVDGQS